MEKKLTWQNWALGVIGSVMAILLASNIAMLREGIEDSKAYTSKMLEVVVKIYDSTAAIEKNSSVNAANISSISARVDGHEKRIGRLEGR